MITRNRVSMLSIGFIFFGAIFAGLALAQGPPVPLTTCDLVGKDGTLSGYTLTRVVTDDPTEWKYAISGFSGTQISVVVPKVWPVPTVYSGEGWIFQDLPAPLSNNWDGFGEWASGSPQLVGTFVASGFTDITFYTDKVVPDTYMPVQLKKGRDYYYCSISGPGWPETPVALSTLHSTCENILSGFDNVVKATVAIDDPFSIKTTIDDATCEVTVTVYSELDCQGDPLENIEGRSMGLDVTGSVFNSLECGSENQRCPICQLKSNRNPCMTLKYAAGRAYPVCYGCTSGILCACNCAPGSCPP